MFVFCHVIYYASICQNKILSNSQKKNWSKKNWCKKSKNFGVKKRKNFSVKKNWCKNKQTFWCKKNIPVFSKKKRKETCLKKNMIFHKTINWKLLSKDCYLNFEEKARTWFVLYFPTTTSLFRMLRVFIDQSVGSGSFDISDVLFFCLNKILTRCVFLLQSLYVLIG